MIPQVKVTGTRELRAAIAALPKELQRTTESAALRDGMRPVLASAKVNVQRSRDSGLLAKSLGLTVRKTRGGTVTARVGARTGFRVVKGVKTKGARAGMPKAQDPVRYAHFVEYGTSRTPAKPFIRPAIDSNINAINEGLARGYARGLDRAVARLRKR